MLRVTCYAVTCVRYPAVSEFIISSQNADCVHTSQIVSEVGARTIFQGLPFCTAAETAAVANWGVLPLKL
jgi:hypothetical protein